MGCVQLAVSTSEMVVGRQQRAVHIFRNGACLIARSVGVVVVELAQTGSMCSAFGDLRLLCSLRSACDARAIVSTHLECTPDLTFRPQTSFGAEVTPL